MATGLCKRRIGLLVPFGPVCRVRQAGLRGRAEQFAGPQRHAKARAQPGTWS